MATKLPTISTDGVIDSPERIGDRLMAYYRVSQASQSYIFDGNVVSLPYRISVFDNNEVKLREEVRMDLEGLFGRFFDAVTVDVDTTPDPEFADRVVLRIFVDFLSNETRFTLGKAVTIKDGRLYNVEGIQK